MAEDQEGVYTVTMAQVYERQGLFEKARHIYEQLLAKDPRRTDLAEALARVQASQAASGVVDAARLRSLFAQWVSLNMALRNRKGIQRLLGALDRP